MEGPHIGNIVNNQQLALSKPQKTRNYGGSDLYVLNIFCSAKQVIDDQSRLPFIDEVMVQRLLFYFSRKMGEP